MPAPPVSWGKGAHGEPARKPPKAARKPLSLPQQPAKQPSQPDGPAASEIGKKTWFFKMHLVKIRISLEY